MRLANPVHLILFGATGNLASRKLYPALARLMEQGLLPEAFAVTGVGRKPWTTEQFRAWAREQAAQAGITGGDHLWGRLHYHSMDFGSDDDYQQLESALLEREKQTGTEDCRVCYLATAPEYFPVIAERLAALRQAGRHSGRLMIEKPFGYDLQSARHFNRALQGCFSEESIFRIDHYLGKEMIRNILVLRFSNRIFEPAWNRDHIEQVQITVAETAGVELRGSYYERSGVLRDMVQSHMLQLLALTAMDRPTTGGVEAIRDEKVKLLNSLRPFDAADGTLRAVLGQYRANDGMTGYTEEPGVAPDSATETFSALRVCIDNDRWRGVPFFIRTGKRMASHTAKITVVFRRETGLFGESAEPNRLIFRIQPEEGVDLRYSSKRPGTLQEISQVSMNYCQSCQYPGQSPEAYEKLLYDAFYGDVSLFARWDEIEAAWRFVDSVRQSIPESRRCPFGYEAGSWGPKESDDWMAAQGFSWLDL